MKKKILVGMGIVVICFLLILNVYAYEDKKVREIKESDFSKMSLQEIYGVLNENTFIYSYGHDKKNLFIYYSYRTIIKEGNKIWVVQRVTQVNSPLKIIWSCLKDSLLSNSDCREYIINTDDEDSLFNTGSGEITVTSTNRQIINYVENMEVSVILNLQEDIRFNNLIEDLNISNIPIPIFGTGGVSP